jgi:hypothetical protein
MSPSADTVSAPTDNAAGFDFGGGDLAALTSTPTFKTVEAERAYLKERLVSALRIFAQQDFDHGVAGHLTVRDPGEPHCFWVNPFGLAFRIMTVEDLSKFKSE